MRTPEEIKLDKTVQELSKELNEMNSDGDLTLGIFCTKCGAQFELGKEGVAMAFITGASFIEYLNYVQSSKCHICNDKEFKSNKHND